jgi:hypothetical protein
MRTGALRSPAGREPCIVKDVSPSGALVSSRSAPDCGTFVSLRIKGGGEARGHVVRTDGALVGIRFEREIDLRRLLGDGKRRFGRSRAALPHVEVRRPALLDDGSGPAPVRVVRVSQGGARIAGFGRPLAAAGVTLCLPGLAPVEARVARLADDRLDLVFKHRIGFGELAAWLASQEVGAQDAPEAPRHAAWLAAILKPLRILLPAAALCFLLLTIGSRLSPAEADPVQRPVNEAWQPQLAGVRSVDAAMHVLPTFIARQHGSRQERIVNGIDAFVRARFVHGAAMLPVNENWMIRALGTVFPTVAIPVLPDEILKHDHALCSQQSLVFQALLRRSGIDYASVRMNWPGRDWSTGHFAVAAKVDGVWRFYDADEEIARPGMPVARLLDGSGVPILYRDRPDVAAKVAYAVRHGRIEVDGENAFPAPRGALLQVGTEWLSTWGWLLLAAAAAAAWYGNRLVGRDSREVVAEQAPPLKASLAA